MQGKFDFSGITTRRTRRIQVKTFNMATANVPLDPGNELINSLLIEDDSPTHGQHILTHNEEKQIKGKLSHTFNEDCFL